MASAYDRIKASRRKFHESAGLTDQDIANFQQNYVARQDGAQLVADLKTAEQNLINSPATVRDQHKALADYASAMDRVSTFVGLGGQAPGVDDTYMQSLYDQYNKSWQSLQNQVRSNYVVHQIPGLAEQAQEIGNFQGQEMTPVRLAGMMGLVDRDGNLTDAGQEYWQRNAYREMGDEAGQEAARWSEQTDSAMSELETVQYWQDVVRKLPQGDDARIVSSNQEWMRQAAEATGITSYTDAADLSSQLAARESQLRAQSGWSGIMRDRNAGRQRTAMAYEYQLDNPDESIEANYYLALRDQAESDLRHADNFVEGMGDRAAIGDWLRYNSAYGDQLYQDQKNADLLALRTDANLSGIYQGALESTRKANEAGQLLDQAKMEVSDYGGVGAKTEQDVRALAETYGIPVTGGDDSLIAVLEQIYQQQMHTVNTNVARLSAQGYDGERVQQYIEQSLNEQSMDEYTAETRAYAQENPGAASVKSSLANLLSGGSYLSAAPQAFTNAMAGITGNYENYVPIDTNSENFEMTQYVTSVRDEVAKNIVENGGDDFGYNVGMSILDNMVQMAVGAMTFGAFGASSAAGQGARAVIQAGIQSSAPVTLATMGLGAASQELVSLTEQGVSSDQAYALATVKGALEIVTERIGIDNLVSNIGKQYAGNMLQQIVGMAAKQSAAEGTEEIIAEAGGLFADWLIRQDESEIMQTIEAGRRSGLTEDEALWQAFKQYGMQVLEAGEAGALSGLFFGAMSTVGVAADAISPASTGARIRAEGNEEALGAIATAYGIEYSPNMSDRQIGKTYRAVQKAAGRLQQDLQQGMSMDTYAQEKGYDAKTTRALNRSWDAYHSVYGNNMSSREFAATWNSMKAAGQANMGFADAVSELGETTLSQATLQNAWKSGQRLYNQAQKAAQKVAKNAPVAAQENVQQPTESAATLASEIGEGAPVQTQLVERSSESASNHARELMDERINVNGLSDDVVESFYDEVDSDISTERRGALSVARMLTGVSKNISQVILVDNATTDAEGHVRLMSNGMWDPTNRTITIDINAGVKNVEQQMTFMTRAMSHEITHSIKTTAPKQYAELERFVLREMDKKISLDKMIEAKIEGYAKEGIELDRQGAIDELVAEACEQMLERTDVLNKLAQENKTLWEKIKDYIKSAIQKLKNLYKGMKANSPEAQMLQGVIDELQRKWDAVFAASLTAEAAETTGDTQHSIAGRNAEIANIIALDEAKQMEVDGYSESEIYQQTGWFRGADNMWRFEIDDSTMRYTPERIAQKMVDGAVHLEDVIDHPVLFSAYPRLRDVSVTFTPMKPGAEGVYRRAENRIYLADSNKNSPESTLVHEIQHAIQALEGFAYGASRAYWANIINNGGKIDSKRLRDATAAVRKFEGNKANQPVIDARNRLEDAYDKSVRDGNAMYAQMQVDGMATKVDTYDELLNEQSNAGVAYLNSLPIELYMNTAGEQEARDVAERRTMTAEQRKAKMPQTGTKDTVFVEGSAVEKVGVQLDTATKSAAPVQYSLNTWNSSDYVTNAEKAAADLAKKLDMSKAQAEKYIDAVNSIAKTIAESHGILDYESSPGRSSFVSNVEYGGSFDFSTLCAKRRLMTGTFSAIQEALPNTVLTATDVLEIRNRMKDAGLEVSCGLCYVEGSRANMGTFTKKFLELYEKHYGGFVPNMAQMNTPDGIEWVRLNHPEVYEQYEYFWNHYGTLKPGDPKLFASQQKPKLYQMRTEYKGEVLKNFTDPKAIKAKNDNGGIRLQSFSDFEIVHLIDCMQIITDMARVGLAGQAYTKVPEFAWALGDTGLKINLSLIAKGVDANGRLIFDDVEGMEINEAMRIRDRYSENVGTILVIFNDEQLKAAMADDRVDFIIPFHRSQWKKIQYSAMGLPEKTKDYTYMQNERYIKPQYHEYRGRMVRDKATNYMPNTYWKTDLSGKENAELYLRMCAEDNKRPKFYRLLDNNGDGSYSLKKDGSTDGYWKLLIDFKMYDNDGNFSPQNPVRPDFNMEKANEMLENYKGGHRKFPVAQQIVDEFVADYKKAHPKVQYQISRDYTEGEPNDYTWAFHDGILNGVDMKRIDAAVAEFKKIGYPKPMSKNGEMIVRVGYRADVKGSSDNKIVFVRGDFLRPMITGVVVINEKNVAIMHIVREEIINDAVSHGHIDLQVEIENEIAGYEYISVREIRNSESLKRENNPRAGTAGKGNSRTSRKGRNQYQVNRDTASDMDLLMGASMDGLSKAEADHLLRYRDRVNEIRKNQRKIDELQAEELTADVNAQIKRLENANSIIYRRVSSAEQTDLMQRIIERERAAGDVEVQRMDNRVADLEDEIDDLGQKIRNAKLAGQMAQGRHDAPVLRKTEERLKRTERTVKEYEAQLEAKRRELKLVREKRDARISKMQESRRKGIEDRQRAVFVHKIRNIAKDLRQRTLRPTNGKYVPGYLVNAVVDVANMIDDAPGEGTKARVKYDNMRAALKELKEQYDDLERDADPDYNYEYDREFSLLIKELADSVGNTPVAKMTNEQVEDVYSILRDIRYTLIDAAHQIGTLERITNYETGTAIIEEMQSVAAERKLLGEFGNKAAGLALSPMRNVHKMTGYRQDSVLMELFNAMNEGIRRQNMFTMEANQIFDSLRDGKNAGKFSAACNDVVDFDLTDVYGKPVRMTRMEAMQIILSAEREAANKDLIHIQTSGVKIADPSLMRKGRVSEAISKGQEVMIGPEQLQKLRDGLEQWDKDFMDAARRFFNEKSRDAINETSMQLKHRKLATGKAYIPFHVDPNFVNREIEGLKIDSTIEGAGSLKSLSKKATQPLIITGLNHIIEDHISFVGKYYGLAIPIKNFNKAYNVKKVGSNLSVKRSIDAVWGKTGQRVIEDTVRDLQKSRERANDILSKGLQTLQSSFVKAALLSNISVTIKQAASYSTAGLLLSQRALAPYQATVARLFGNPNSKYAKNLFAEIDAHTAQHWIRRKGLSTQELGDYVQRQGRLAEFDRKLPASLNPIKWIQNMDVATTAALWLAAKNEISHIGNYTENSDEYWAAVTELYDQVIEQTQPMYDVMHRPEVQKTTNELVRQMVMFRTQPLQNTGVIYDAFGELAAANASNDAQWKRDASKKARRAAFSQVASLTVFATMTMIAGAVTHRLGRYRDDDEELTVLSVMLTMLGDIGQNAAGVLIPVGGAELYDVIVNKLIGSSRYETVAIPVAGVINDYIDALSKVTKGFEEQAQADDPDWGAAWMNVLELGKLTAELFGIPANNVEKILVGFYENAKDIAAGNFPAFNNDVERENSVNYRRLYQALADGDMEKFDEVYAEVSGNLSADGEEDVAGEIASGLQKQIKDAYLDGELTDEEATEFLVNYVIELSAGVERQHDTGTITDEEYMTMLENEAYWTIKGWNARVEDSDASTSKYADLRAVIESGGDSTAAVEELLAHGETEDDVSSGASSIIADLYKNGEIDAATAEAYLAEYAGITDSKDLYTWFTEKDHWIETGESDYGAYGPVWDAIIEGGDVDGAIDAMVDAGWTEIAVAEEIRTRAKEWVLGTATDGYTISTDEARNILSKYGGVDDDDLDMYIDWYDFQMENPGYADDFSMEAVQKYNEYGSGIGLDVYADFMDATGEMEADIDPDTGKSISGSKKAKVMDYIDAMPISDEQKDQLYYAAGYKQSTIYEAPWH